MKPMIKWMTALGILVCIASCTKRYCLTPSIQGIYFSDTSFTDTAVILSGYQKESNFTNLTDTFHLLIQSDSLSGFAGTYHVGFPYLNLYFCDWILAFYPSNRTFKIKNLTHSNDFTKEAITEDDEGENYCVNTIYYVMNDTPTVIYGQPTESDYANVYMGVKY